MKNNKKNFSLTNQSSDISFLNRQLEEMTLENFCEKTKPKKNNKNFENLYQFYKFQDYKNLKNKSEIENIFEIMLKNLPNKTKKDKKIDFLLENFVKFFFEQKEIEFLFQIIANKENNNLKNECLLKNEEKISLIKELLHNSIS